MLEASPVVQFSKKTLRVLAVWRLEHKTWFHSGSRQAGRWHTPTYSDLVLSSCWRLQSSQHTAHRSQESTCTGGVQALYVGLILSLCLRKQIWRLLLLALCLTRIGTSEGASRALKVILLDYICGDPN